MGVPGVPVTGEGELDPGWISCSPTPWLILICHRAGGWLQLLGPAGKEASVFPERVGDLSWEGTAEGRSCPVAVRDRPTGEGSSLKRTHPKQRAPMSRVSPRDWGRRVIRDRQKTLFLGNTVSGHFQHCCLSDPLGRD